MIEADQVLDQDPNSYENIKKLVENDIRNKLGFKELQSFNDNGNFLWKHTILKHHKLRSELSRLKRDNPEKFMNEHANAVQNIRRYQSKINTGKYKGEDEKKNIESHIEKFKEKRDIITDLLNDE